MTLPRVILVVLSCCVCAEIIGANVLFHFAINFGIKDNDDDNSMGFNKTIEVASNKISVINNNNNEIIDLGAQNQSVGTESPPLIDAISGPNEPVWVIYTSWTHAHRLESKIQETRKAIQNLNRELMPLVGHSGIIAAKVKMITRYLNEVDSLGTIAASLDVANYFKVLRSYRQLVEDLRKAPAVDGGERSLEHYVMQFALTKYECIKLDEEVKDILVLEDAWERHLRQMTDIKN